MALGLHHATPPSHSLGAFHPWLLRWAPGLHGHIVPSSPPCQCAHTPLPSRQHQMRARKAGPRDWDARLCLQGDCDHVRVSGSRRASDSSASGASRYGSAPFPVLLLCDVARGSRMRPVPTPTRCLFIPPRQADSLVLRAYEPTARLTIRSGPSLEQALKRRASIRRERT